MNRIFFVLVFGLMFFGFVSGVSVDDSIYERFDSGDERVRVLMKVSDDVKMTKGFSVSRFKSVRIDDVISDDKINKRVGDYVSAYVDRDELERLVKNGIVESVGVERVYHTMLQDSVGIINASASWRLKVNGLNLTGTGQTVCIIDSGVNYSHADFGGCTSSEFLAGDCAKVIGGWDFCGNDGDCSIEDGDPMDVVGHGTHVAGIVAASGGISGVGPGTNIVMMKASNSSGVFFTINIVAAIDWCVANASVFNISVISMSLGGDQYTGYCDSSDVDNIAIASSINSAVANNISVVVATGNTNGDYPNAVDGIASPACIENVTRVTASTKGDLYAGYGFRHANFPDILVAPGGSGAGSSLINSTVIGGGYGGMTGTSMAAPMVAGAIAIINQYLGLSEQTMTTGEVESVLNDSGVVLDDSGGSGYNFSRINVYSAVLSLDVDAPNVTLVSPVDDKINLNVNQSFVCNATDWQLANLTLMVWNSTGLYYNGTDNLTGTSNETSFNLTDMSLGDYEWNCLVFDSESNSAYASVNFSLTIGGVATTLLLPATENYTAINDTNFSCSVSSDANHVLTNVTFYLWNSSGNLTYNLTEDISGFSNTSVFNYSFVDEGNYSWNCFGVNNVSNSSWGDANFSIVYDVSVPNLILTSLPFGATSNSISRNFGFNVSDDNLDECVLIIADEISLTNSSMNQSVSQTFSKTFTPGTYTWEINCSDFAGNVNSSSENSFTITAVTSSSSSSSSGGGGSVVASVAATPETFDVSTVEVSGGYTKSLKKDERVNFSIFDAEGGRHLLTVDDVGVDYVDLTIESEPVILRLGVGQSAKLNLTSADYYDLMVRLNNISGDAAELTIQLINETIVRVVEKVIDGEMVETEIFIVKDYFWVVVILIVVLVAIVVVVVRVNKAKKLKGSKVKKKRGRKRKKAKAKAVGKR